MVRPEQQAVRDRFEVCSSGSSRGGLAVGGDVRAMSRRSARVSIGMHRMLRNHGLEGDAVSFSVQQLQYGTRGTSATSTLFRTLFLAFNRSLLNWYKVDTATFIRYNTTIEPRFHSEHTSFQGYATLEFIEQVLLKHPDNLVERFLQDASPFFFVQLGKGFSAGFQGRFDHSGATTIRQKWLAGRTRS